MSEKEKRKRTLFKQMVNGPLQVSGNFVIIDASGEKLEIKNEALLCRCGGSSNKPFCDNTHKTIGVKD
jgi:CDGSH-type Zn-finger protein